jgi:hypothetical protein
LQGAPRQSRSRPMQFHPIALKAFDVFVAALIFSVFS